MSKGKNESIVFDIQTEDHRQDIYRLYTRREEQGDDQGGE